MDQTGWVIAAPAKVNWTLRVVGRRSDGYHDIESLVSKLDLADALWFEDRGSGQLELHCDNDGLPGGQDNLVLRAAQALRRTTGVGRGMSCRLCKRIPVGGGLGGGSADAAATLVALNAIWSLGLTQERLAAVGAEVGSDVPLFMAPGSVVMRGRGEIVAPVPARWSGTVVLLLPGIEVSTARVYAAWRPPSEKQANPVLPEPCPDAREWMSRTFNMLEEPAFRIWPVLGEIQRAAGSLAGREVRMSGSGSTFMTAFDDPEEADRFAAAARAALNLRTQVVRTIEQGLTIRRLL